MSLGLDLSASSAKIDRAFEHLHALKREISLDLAKQGPYAIRFSQVDKQTGWCEMFIGPTPNQARKPRPGIIIGDIVHNLRCALDYIVTSLADASGVQLTTKHQFPIFIDASQYALKVGTVSAANPSGPLGGITYGLGLIEQLQPYRAQPNPRADPLWHVHRFSNADKHRYISATMDIPIGSLDIDFNGILAEHVFVPDIPNWSPDNEYVIARLRFDPPEAYNLHVKGPLTLIPGFRTPAFGGEPEHAMGIAQLENACKFLRIVAEQFQGL